MRVIMWAGIIFFMIIEVHQMIKFGFVSHFSEFWNWIYFLIYTLNVCEMVVNVYGG